MFYKKLTEPMLLYFMMAADDIENSFYLRNSAGRKLYGFTTFDFYSGDKDLQTHFDFEGKHIARVNKSSGSYYTSSDLLFMIDGVKQIVSLSSKEMGSIARGRVPVLKKRHSTFTGMSSNREQWNCWDVADYKYS